MTRGRQVSRTTTRRQFLARAAQALAAAVVLVTPAAGQTTHAAGLSSPETPPTARSAGQLAAQQGQPAQPSAFEALLRGLPDMPGNRYEIYLNDLAVARERIGLPPLAGDADSGAAVAHAKALYDAGIGTVPFVSGMDGYMSLTWKLQGARGFHPGMISQTALAGEPPDQVELIRGQFNPNDIEQATTGCGECPPFERLDVQGLPFYVWGEDFEQDVKSPLRPPFFDSLGRGGRLRVDHNHIFRTVATPTMVTAIETSLGQHPSLAEAPGYLAMANGLAGLGAFSVFLSGAVDRQQVRPGTGARLGVPLLRPYLALGVGNGQEVDGSSMSVALHHSSEQLASENAEILPRVVTDERPPGANRPWSEMIGSAETRTEGPVLLARLRLKEPTPRFWIRWYFAGDRLLLWE